MSSLALAAKLARRELRSGFSGLRIFFSSLVLGVAAIAAVGSLAAGLLAGLADNGRTILGGDVEIALVHRPLTADERAFAAAQGRISQAISMRAMVYDLRGAGAGARELVELKAVDSFYPLYGSVGLSPSHALSMVLACDRDGICGAAAEQTMLERLQLRRGALVRIGRQKFRIAAILTNEPDRLSGGFSLGPHVIISTAGLARTGLVTTGSLIDYRTRVRLRPGLSAKAFREAENTRFPAAGWQIRDRDHAAPGTERFIREFADFLTLVGLSALAIGGVGAGQAVRAFLDLRLDEIATLKSMGGTGCLVILVYFLQVMTIAMLASLVGAIAGATVPLILLGLFGVQLSVPVRYGIFPGPLAISLLFGLLSAAAFAIPPLARAKDISPALLFRDLVSPAPKRGRLPYLVAAASLGVALVALALAVSPSLSFALWFIVCAGGGLFALSLAAALLQFLLRRAPAVSWQAARFALSSLARPGAPMNTVITALGLGLSLLATVTILNDTISAQVNGSLAATAPSFYFADIQPADAKFFDRTIARFRSASDYRRTPMIRGRIEAVNGVPAARAHVTGNARWALNGDRGITYSAKEPEGTQLAAGRWWPNSYRGPTLISFDSELARGMGLKIGDTLTLNVLGRDIEGRIANLRHVDFSTGRQNFVLILSPGLIDKAPHSFLATVRVPLHDETALYRAVTDRFPSVSTIRVREVIGGIDSLLAKIGFGVRAASIVTILAGLLVLAGALTAGLRKRAHDAAVMKILGATRLQIACAWVLEYALLGSVAGALAFGAALAAAWLVSRRVFGIPPVLDWSDILLTIGGGAVFAVLFGIALTWRALAARPAQQLRSL